MRLTSTCVLVLSVFAFAGSAYAGNGNGNGNGAGNAAPGNSANAPGQQKKDAESAPAETTTTTAVATTTTTTATTTTASNSVGVKPSNTTAHDTHAEAQSDKTKQYGNGQTAGQIAVKNGAPKNTVLHGPGNSQPHKATPCAGGHEVDVHALKSHRGGKCGSDPTPDPNPNPNPNPHPTPDPNPMPDPKPPVTTSTTTTTTTATTTPGSDPSKPGKESNGDAGGSHGVLSGTQRVGHAASLPFTGQSLWVAVLAGLILIATGLALREIRTAESSVESGHDRSDRAR